MTVISPSEPPGRNPARETPPPLERGLALLAAGTLVSRLLGFIRDMLAAALLGPAADAFLVAFRLPNVFRRLLAEGSLGLSVGAAVAGLTQRQGPGPALALGARLARRLFFRSALTLPLLALAAGAATGLLAPGLTGPAGDQAVLLFRCCLPYLPLCLYSALIFAVAAAFGDQRLQALGPAALNLSMIAFGGAALILCRENSDLSALLLSLGLCCGGLVQALVARRWLRRQKEVAPAPTASERTAEDALLRALPRAVLGAAPHQLHLLAGMMLASLAAPGSISALYFAERLVELPLGLAGAALGLAVLPGLAANAADRNFDVFTHSLDRAVSFGAFVSLPAAAGLAALAGPLADLLFGRGAYGPEAVAATAAALRGYALGLPALCAARPLLAACHALGAGRATLNAALLSLVPVAAVSLACMPLAGRDAAAAVGLGLAAGGWCNVWLLARMVARALKAAKAPQPRYLAGRIPAYAGAAAVLAVVLAALPEAFAGPWQTLLLVPVCACLWLFAFARLGSPEARQLLGLLRLTG